MSLSPRGSERFQREMYMPSAGYFSTSGNMEKRMRDKAKKSKESIDNVPEQKEKPTIPKLIRHFLGYTTAHGMSRLGDSEGVFWKIFWSLICLGSFAMFGYQAHGLFMIYFSRPVSTNLRITFEKQVPFPAVTVCNMNMLRSEKIPQSLKKELAKQYHHYNASQDVSSARKRRDVGGTTHGPHTTQAAQSSGSGSLPDSPTTSSYPGTTSWDSLTTYATTDSSVDTPYNSYTTPYNSYTSPYNSYTSPYNSYTSHTTYNSYDNDYYYYTSYGGSSYDKDYLPSQEEVDENALFMERFITFVTRVPENQLREAGHQFDDFITNCTWRGYDCKTGNFSKWWYQSWNYKYGNCYTFNGGKEQNNDPIRVLSTSKPGPSQGLSLRLEIEQDKYLKTVSAEAGVRVILHDQGVMPFPFQEGFSVSPGMATSVGIQKTVIKRVDRFDNNTCWNIDELDEKNIYRKYHNITKYTQQTCQNSCLGRAQFEECGCSEYTYPSSRPACDAFNDTLRLCLWRVYVKFNNDLLPCVDECRQPCREDVIQKTISMSQWPSTQFENFVKETDKEFTPQSALLLNVFYNELNYQRIEEDFVYDEIKLLSDIGGQLGLWIGVSVITCVEVLELFILIATRIVRMIQGEGRVHNTPLPP